MLEQIRQLLRATPFRLLTSAPATDANTTSPRATTRTSAPDCPKLTFTWTTGATWSFPPLAHRGRDWLRQGSPTVGDGWKSSTTPPRAIGGANKNTRGLIRSATLTGGLEADFANFLPIGSKEAKQGDGGTVLFKDYSNGIKSQRDQIVFGITGTP